MEALQFGDRHRPLFGIRSEPTGPVRQTAVLICPSWGMEYLRAYRASFLLAEQLSRQGFEVLRFDYSGTGDSAGNGGDARLENWIADIGSAASELRELSGCSKLCVLGLRLGALLAIRAIRDGLRADQLVLWDPPASGRAWVQELRQLEAAQHLRKNRHRQRRYPLTPGPGELLGASFPAALSAAIEELEPGPPLPGRQILHLHNADQPPPTDPDINELALADSGHWSELAWLTTPWVPPTSLPVICERMRGWLP